MQLHLSATLVGFSLIAEGGRGGLTVLALLSCVCFPFYVYACSLCSPQVRKVGEHMGRNYPADSSRGGSALPL
jgi:hypothetical protein